ncbi:hypothetical protein GXM_02868 [Nostoc sphaeroides CCNUC1]|uniref:Uncharacterized protein n=1 Tax=Nostoc sphaeroides CCNUC1 TaxID=2653204 RepID=A0A5P8VYK0_9NOSO|nr:hypothetical protein GXM_02868 [Nostoc sphaeroides CCNUC1]
MFLIVDYMLIQSTISTQQARANTLEVQATTEYWATSPNVRVACYSTQT